MEMNVFCVSSFPEVAMIQVVVIWCVINVVENETALQGLHSTVPCAVRLQASSQTFGSFGFVEIWRSLTVYTFYQPHLKLMMQLSNSQTLWNIWKYGVCIILKAVSNVLSPLCMQMTVDQTFVTEYCSCRQIMFTWAFTEQPALFFHA